MVTQRVVMAALSFMALGVLPAVSQTVSLRNQATMHTSGVADADERHLHRSRIFWLVSVPIFVAANILDAQSSWGKRENNPLLQSQAGRFDARSATIKFAGSAAIVFGEYSLSRWLNGNPKRQREVYVGSAWSNFLGAGALTAVAAHNYRQPSLAVTVQR